MIHNDGNQDVQNYNQKNYNNKQHQHKSETKSALCKCLLNEHKQWRLESENSFSKKQKTIKLHSVSDFFWHIEP